MIEGGALKKAGRKSCTFIDQDAIPHYYCDSVSGSDSNDGLSEGTAKATVSAVTALASGPCVFEFKRGSYFREQLTVPEGDYVVKAYGHGDRPIFDCADVVSTFTKTGGFTNVYQVTYNNELTDAGKTKISMWFDETRMIRVTSQSLCDSTPASFYAIVSGTGTDTVYFHNPDSTDPNGDGRVYEVAVRNYGVVCTNRDTNTAEIYSVRTQRNGNNDGSLIGAKYISDCYAYDGTVHNMWNGGIAEDCIAERAECFSSGGTTYFVSYRDTNDNTSYRYTRCQAIGLGTASFGWKELNCPGFFAHTASGADPLEHILFEDCKATGCGAFGLGNVKNAAFYNSEAISCREGFDVAKVSSAFVGSKVHYKTSGGSVLKSTNRCIQGSASQNVFINGCSFCVSEVSGAMLYGKLGDNVVINSSDFRQALTVSTAGIYDNLASLATVNFQKCIFSGVDTNRNKFIFSASNLTVISDSNLWEDELCADGTLNGVPYSNLTAWQALSSQDGNSITGDPLFTGDTATGDFSIDAGSPANSIGAGSTNYVVTAQDLRYMNVLNPVYQ